MSAWPMTTDATIRFSMIEFTADYFLEDVVEEIVKAEEVAEAREHPDLAASTAVVVPDNLLPSAKIHVG